jgi:hypothetical protein
VRRLGLAVLEPVPLLSLVATSPSFRLVFEQNLFGYYFMALAVSLVLLEAVRGHVRGQMVAWIALLILAFDPVPWGNDPIPKDVPLWLVQIVLVSIGGVLASTPLISLTRNSEGSHLFSESLVADPFPDGEVVIRQKEHTLASNR